MRILATILGLFLFVSLSGQTLQTNEKPLFTMEESAQRVIDLYSMDATQANSFKSALRTKVNSTKVLDGKNLSKNEYAVEKQKIDAAYDNSMLSLLNENQQKVYEYQKELVNTLVNKQNTPIPANSKLIEERK